VVRKEKEGKVMQSATKAEVAYRQDLASRPNTDVLEYVYDEPEREAPASVCVGLAQRTVEARRAFPALSDAEAKSRICQSDIVLAQFARTHPQIFSQMASSKTAGRALEMLMQLARIRSQVDSREMSEAEAQTHVSRVIMEKTMRNPTDHEKSTLNFT
jgi:hypothetical protein